ncbi:MAG: glycosyltransferase family 2 protein [Clostridia bacterium]|nr:glycosyltransferase family 2 protein [Clostridia bacterium]
MEYLYIIQQALVWLITIFWLYQLSISICSLVKLKDKPLLVNKNHRFMAIIPAHNEEAVIRELVESLQKQDYPKELLDIYVIADNCDDNTARIAREAGAIVYERFDPEKKTKGYALDWFLKQKIEENAPYDAFCVFDADNIVDPNFIKNMNKKLCQGEDVVQGYRDIKNPTDNWITAGYAIFYWTMNRFYHLARYNVGLSPLINGTGFMVKFDVVKPDGWDTKTLTEDIEFSLKRIIKGKKLGWAVDAIVYDEQPLGFKQSWKQRTRWTVGHMQCIKEYTKPLAVAVKENKTLMNFDGFLYIIGSIPMFVATIVLLLFNFVMYSANGMSELDLGINIARYVVPTFFLPILTAVFIMWLDKKPIKPMIKGLLCYPLFLGSWLLINFKCLFKRDTSWDKIEHVRKIAIQEVSETEKVEN